MNQLERYEWLEKKILNSSTPEAINNSLHRVWRKKLEILRNNPEYIDKLKHFAESDLYKNNSNKIIFYIEVGSVEL